MKQIIFICISLAVFASCKDKIEPTPKGNPYAGQHEYLHFSTDGLQRNCQNTSFVLDTNKIIADGDAVILSSEPMAHFEVYKNNYPGQERLNISLRMNSGEQYNQIKDSCWLDIDVYENYHHGVFSGYLRSDQDASRIIHIENGEFLGISKH